MNGQTREFTEPEVAETESASRCDRCGETVRDIDAGFSPGTHHMAHEGCGGTWQRVRLP